MAEEPMTIEDVVRPHVIDTCERKGWDLKLAARTLGICLKTLYTYLNRYREQGYVAKVGRVWMRCVK